MNIPLFLKKKGSSLREAGELCCAVLSCAVLCCLVLSFTVPCRTVPCNRVRRPRLGSPIVFRRDSSTRVGESNLLLLFCIVPTNSRWRVPKLGPSSIFIQEGVP